MNILVLLRAIQDPAGITVNRRAQKVFVNQPRSICNPADRNALEAAFRLSGLVQVAALGGPTVEPVLRDARAAGAAAAMWVQAPELERADALVQTRVWRSLVQRLGNIDLVLCGAEVLDADLAQVGPRLAQALGWPFLSLTHQLQAEAGELRAVVARGGEFRQVAANLPAVASVARDANRPRLAPGARIINIYRDPAAVETLSPDSLGLSAADLAPAVEIRGEAFPPERELGRRLEGSLAEQARTIAESLIR